MSNIPKARERLNAIIKELEKSRFTTQLSKRLREISTLLDREPPVRKTKPKSVTMTQQVANGIKLTLKNYPSWSFQRIADHHGVNQGRVSDVAKGKWG